jgi:hypothetical protein
MPTIVVSESASQAISSAVTAVALKASVSGKHGPEFLPGRCYLRVNQAFRVHRPQSSSSSRLTAAQAGFFIFTQSGERPEM